MKKLSVLGIIGGAALLTAAPFSLQWSQQTVTLSLDTADARAARVGRVAGVQRRSYRRAARSTIYAGAAGAVGYGVGAYYGGYDSPAYAAPPYGTGYGYAPSYGGNSYPAYSYPASNSPGSTGYGYPGYGGGYPAYGYGDYSRPGYRAVRGIAIRRGLR
jgi:hypothetical protein